MSRRSPIPAAMSGGVLFVSVLLLALVVIWRACPEQLEAFEGSDGFLMTSEPADSPGWFPYMSIDERRAAGGGDGEVGIVLDATFGDIGAYGGTLADTCDTPVLITHLTERDAQAGERWATAAGIPLADVTSFLRGLSADVLVDGAVLTLNGDDDGTRVGQTTLLAPGTAVLADADGVARVRCLDGNPLTPSVDVAAATAAQPGFDLDPPTTDN